jgi:hypothetical protein
MLHLSDSFPETYVSLSVQTFNPMPNKVAGYYSFCPAMLAEN